MEKWDTRTFKYIRYLFITAVILFNVSVISAQNIKQSTTSQTNVSEGTSKIWGYVDNIAIIGLVEGPSTADVELQIACVFEYTEGDIFNSPPALPTASNGMLHLDQALNGKITEIRKTGQFSGQALTTFLIIPPKGALKPKKLLLIGLGDRNSFTPDLMTSVGIIATRESIKLGVREFGLSSDLKDAGIDSLTALIVENMVKGIIEAIQVENYMKANNLSHSKKTRKIYLLAGSAFFSAAGHGIKKAIDENQNISKNGIER